MYALIILNSEDPRAGPTTMRAEVDVDRWPPPKRLLGREFMRELVGTYELRDATDGTGVLIARYYLRIDEDFHRLMGNRARLRDGR
jgi:hypothetical protein